MQAVMETAFDAVYLVLVITLGIIMLVSAKGRRQYSLFGLMAVILGSGDAFHLVPRALALSRGLDLCVWSLALIRIVLCLFPQNMWTSADAPLSWGILRNIPFALMGLVVIVLFYRSAKAENDSAFRWMWLTIVLSFAFYIPVVLWADAYPMIGMLMIPKTIAYVWTVVIGFTAMRHGK